ncbi:Eco47II family restriction endonuclease [Cyanobacterium sp. IPPAS B-1200]|uniref:Eco47II family restriction endonuclease n=1 Tax=Cyanobacterium sp. IPPAS B-1200 TaxID=1562720 RepID=UPI0008524A3D|nr:Eco47II family restriction endonuclease [Cyanobacterium sp. IPPAS B-1200]OEJ79738.1 restriction endonuclease [Cyanobacterium sp. IPPAS B-1200]
MAKYNLSFINDTDLYNHTKETVEKYTFKINLKTFSKNLIDPIKLTFDSKVYNKNIVDVIENEIIRQMNKSNTNHIGYFHQNIFQYMGNGWEVPKRGYDVINKKLNYYVEMKNKHNTINFSSSQKTYMRMQNTLLNNPEATCMLVEVVAKKSQNIVWNISLDSNTVSNGQIRRVSIDKFYELVTGEKTAFKQLCEILSSVIDDIISRTELNEKQNTVISELLKISPNLLKSIYLLSLRKYQGFDQFNV